MEKQREEIINYIDEMITEYSGEELHEMQRTEGCAKYRLAFLMYGEGDGQYFITNDAHRFLEPNTFECIRYVKEHEELIFGRVVSDFSDACSVANAAARYLAEEIMVLEFGETIDAMIERYLKEEEEEHDIDKC